MGDSYYGYPPGHRSGGVAMTTVFITPAMLVEPVDALRHRVAEERNFSLEYVDFMVDFSLTYSDLDNKPLSKLAEALLLRQLLEE